MSKQSDVENRIDELLMRWLDWNGRLDALEQDAGKYVRLDGLQLHDLLKRIEALEKHVDELEAWSGRVENCLASDAKEILFLKERVAAQEERIKDLELAHATPTPEPCTHDRYDVVDAARSLLFTCEALTEENFGEIKRLRDAIEKYDRRAK